MWEADAEDLFGKSSPQQTHQRTQKSNRMVSGELGPEDIEQERSLRPKTLDEYLGQSRVKENLRVLIQAAKRGMNRLTTLFSRALRDWAKQRLPVSLQAK